jgi:hypothetical protein
MQDPSLTSGAWPVSYETVGSTSGAAERRTPSSGELSLIRSLRDQLQNTQRQLKTVTAKVDVALSKASYAADREKFLLDEIENLGKSLKCESLDLFRCLLSLECAGFDLRPLFTDVCLDSAAEARCVNSHLVAAQTHANSVADNF